MRVRCAKLFQDIQQFYKDNKVQDIAKASPHHVETRSAGKKKKLQSSESKRERAELWCHAVCSWPFNTMTQAYLMSQLCCRVACGWMLCTLA